MKNQLPGWYDGKKRECDRCGFVFALDDLIQQDGLWLCSNCLDEDR